MNLETAVDRFEKQLNDYFKKTFVPLRGFPIG